MYRSSANLEVISNLLVEFWPVFDLGLGLCKSYIYD